MEGWSWFHNKNEAEGSWSEHPNISRVWLVISQPGYSPQLPRKSLFFWGICPGRLTCFAFLWCIPLRWGKTARLGTSKGKGLLELVECIRQTKMIQVSMCKNYEWIDLHVKKVSKSACKTLQCIKNGIVIHTGNPDRGEGGRWRQTTTVYLLWHKTFNEYLF